MTVSLTEIIRAYRALQRIEPKNELLTYMRIEGENAVAWPRERYERFIDKYVRIKPRDKVEDVNDIYCALLVQETGEAQRRAMMRTAIIKRDKKLRKQGKLFP
ncbi:hypothetical protein KY311_05170 [Candidatus Woesearchaeota archaeon]|nr:hypothetical protein [Candidatus Woesearchaeota archaeon]